MLVLELMTLQTPYSELCVLDVKQQVLQGNFPNGYRQLKGKSLPDVGNSTWLLLHQLLDKCLKFDPTERPTAVELLSLVREVAK